MIARATAVYHLHPSELRGDALVPLSTLERTQPDLYERAIAKYRNRMGSLRRPLPELGCLWVDCVQFSTVHPEDLRDAMIAAGFGWPARGRQFLVFDAARLEASATSIWLHRDTSPREDMAAAMTDIVPFSTDRLHDLRAVANGTRAYLAEMAQLERRPLLFVGVPHILHRGPVSLAGSRLLTI
ncbi:hypothetical protein [uncultured Tateyamaria sp.]|uniref:hypothetical protein n=1 Tax=uncultured Tateyamaria sp. TaxID=455651 RepID=UPI0026350D5B|nr:hypothetical protein [uncultured Tateyamaria sp.]